MQEDQKTNLSKNFFGKFPFVKMSGAGNDFVIFDARSQEISLSADDIKNISDRKNIGCDQLIVIKNSQDADCFMQIYNSDGSTSSTCGNATICVASILMKEKKSDFVKIKTAADLLECSKYSDSLISVKMGIPKFSWDKIPLSKKMDSQKVEIDGFNFACVNVGNPHAVSFIPSSLSDEEFFRMGKKVESHEYFPQKVNVEFVQIKKDDLLEVRVFERGAGETLACGSGACAVACAAIKNNFVSSKKITTRFKGGDLIVEWSGEDDACIVMTGGYRNI